MNALDFDFNRHCVHEGPLTSSSAGAATDITYVGNECSELVGGPTCAGDGHESLLSLSITQQEA